MAEDIIIPDESGTKKAKKKGGSFFRKMMWFLLMLGIIYLGISYLLGAVLVYSDGDRSGYIYKISKKGYVFKTYEGILKTGFVNIGNTSTPNEEWEFSVDDDKVAKQIEDLNQQTMVKLHYKQHYLKLFWRGDTKYYVDRVEILPKTN